MERFNRFCNDLSRTISMTKAVAYFVVYAFIGLIGLLQSINFIHFRDAFSLFSGPVFLILALVGMLILYHVIRAIQRRRQADSQPTAQ